MSQPWLKQLVRWLRRVLGFSSSAKRSVKILEQYHTPHSSVFRIEDSDIPGGVDLWRIDRHHENTKFFIAIINLQILRADLGLMRTSPEALLQSRVSGMAGDLQQQLQEQRQINASHFWITGWLDRVYGVDKNGRSYQSNRLGNVNILAVDLQGMAASFAGDRYACRFARNTIKRLANNEFREYNQHPTWKAAVKTIDWEQWLEGLSRNPTNGLGSTHVLRPRKAQQSRHRKG